MKFHGRYSQMVPFEWTGDPECDVLNAFTDALEDIEGESYLNDDRIDWNTVDAGVRYDNLLRQPVAYVRVNVKKK